MLSRLWCRLVLHSLCSCVRLKPSVRITPPFPALTDAVQKDERRILNVACCSCDVTTRALSRKARHDSPFMSGHILRLIRDTTFQSSAYGKRENVETSIDGRVMFDMLPYMFRNHKLSSYSLNSVSAELLGQQKEDVHHSIISDLQARNCTGSQIYHRFPFCHSTSSSTCAYLLEGKVTNYHDGFQRAVAIHKTPALVAFAYVRTCFRLLYFHPRCLPERLGRRSPTSGCVLHKGCASANETYGEVERDCQLHRDGEGDWSAFELSTLQGAADQGTLHSAPIESCVGTRSLRFEVKSGDITRALRCR